MSENNSEIWNFPEYIKKVKIKINDLTIIGFPEKRPVEDVFNYKLPKSTGK